MLRTFRAQTKWVFWILTVSFVGWLAFSQVTDILGPSASTVLEINGRDISATDFERMVRQTEEQYRQQTGALPATRDERRDLENQVVEQIIESVLLQREYERFGIEARPAEIIAAARTSPPPELRNRPEFQTDGQFDPGKWERFLATADPQFQLALEARYREEIPRIKLAQYITADVYLSDAKLWRLYRDQHDSVRVALLALRPEDVPDSGIAVTDDELGRYLRAHEEEYRRPAVAYLRYVALDRRPDRADSAAALAVAREIVTAVSRGGLGEFERRAREGSADSATAAQGGDLGWIARNDRRLSPAVLPALRALRPGEVSAPLLTPLGYEVLRVDQVRGDSVRARRIVIAIELTGDRLDAVERRADSLDRLAAAQTAGDLLDTAAVRLRVPVQRARPLVEGDRLVLGGSIVPDVSVWAFEAAPGETSPVIEGQAAYYVFRLDSLAPAGVPPFAELRGALAAAVRREKRLAAAGRRAAELADEVREARSLAVAGARLGLPVQMLGPFPRVAPPPALAGEPEVLGAAFGLDLGRTAGPIQGEAGWHFVELLSRKPADSLAWAAQKDVQRESVIQAARQARFSAYLAGLRAAADVVDRRQELARRAATQPPPLPPLF